MRDPSPGAYRDLVRDLLDRLDARAAGVWIVEGDRLVQRAFEASAEMPVGVAEGFADATRSVALDRLDLGIVAAVVEGRRKVSVAADLPDVEGSGHWLRAFGARRSVAVPVGRPGEPPLGVVAVALAGDSPKADEVERVLREVTAARLENPGRGEDARPGGADYNGGESRRPA